MHVKTFFIGPNGSKFNASFRESEQETLESCTFSINTLFNDFNSTN